MSNTIFFSSSASSFPDSSFWPPPLHPPPSYPSSSFLPHQSPLLTPSSPSPLLRSSFSLSSSSRLSILLTTQPHQPSLNHPFSFSFILSSHPSNTGDAPLSSSRHLPSFSRGTHVRRACAPHSSPSTPSASPLAWYDVIGSGDNRAHPLPSPLRQRLQRHARTVIPSDTRSDVTPAQFATHFQRNIIIKKGREGWHCSLFSLHFTESFPREC